ncbi:hypothetical protein MTR_3g068050 [Medicago truncatula]|uniref:Uncharacterized protein n=1 Tax=Medicago truncatula TaxID=3880 RepID=A0A072UY50_MEDTR|nr:hypothetical protein MTR_3g068050 [Medicago truncatula]
MPMENENFLSVGASQFPEFSTQITPGGMAVANEVTPNPEDSTPKSRKIINKWIGAYDAAKRLQGSGWSEDDILAKVQELFACGKNVQFTLKEEWHALRDQPHYGSQMGGNVGSGSSGSKRSHDDSVGSSARPMGREAAKKEVGKEWVQFKEIKVQEIEQLEGSASRTRKYFNRDHATANQRLIDDYFANEPTYDDAMFRHRYLMQKHVFLRIIGDLSSSDNYFTQRVDAANKEAYGVAADAVDDYIKIGSSTNWSAYLDSAKESYDCMSKCT